MLHPAICVAILSSTLMLLGSSADAETQSAMPFTLTSSATQAGGSLPIRYTCDGKDIQPAISWKNVPANTQCFAIILADPDAPGGTFYHWVLYNIPKSTTSLPEAMAQLPTGTLAGKIAGINHSTMACPPKGKAHHYILLYALDTLKFASRRGCTNGIRCHANAYFRASNVYDVIWQINKIDYQRKYYKTKYFLNQSFAKCATSASFPGSSNKCVAPGTITNFLSQSN